MPQFRDPNEKRDFMLNTPIPRLVPKMALPSIAGMLVRMVEEVKVLCATSPCSQARR